MKSAGSKPASRTQRLIVSQPHQRRSACSRLDVTKPSSPYTALVVTSSAPPEAFLGVERAPLAVRALQVHPAGVVRPVTEVSLNGPDPLAERVRGGTARQSFPAVGIYATFGARTDVVAIEAAGAVTDFER